MMKKLLLLFALLLGIATTNAQHAIGVVTGTTPIYDVFGKGSDNFVFQIETDVLNAFRYGFRGRFQANEMTAFELGVDRYNQDFRLQIDSNFSFVYHDYQLAYAQILTMGNVEFYLADTESGWTPFIGAKYGLGADILLDETKNNIVQTETDFSKVVLNAIAGSFVGVQKGYFRVSGIFNMQISANSIINSNIIGSTRQFDMSVFLCTSVIF